MGELISQVGLLPTTAGGALLLLCLLVMFGIIPTPGQAKDLRAQITAADARAERWQTAWEKLNEAQLENSKQLEKLVEKTDVAAARDELVVSLLQSIREKAGLT